MLENKRYWLAKRAMLNLALHPEYGKPDEETFQAILDQQFSTQQALAQLGVNALTHPKEVPFINQALFPIRNQKGLSKPIAVHVIGMPKTLKTTMLETFNALGHLTIKGKAIKIAHTEEAAGPLKAMRDARPRASAMNYGEYLVSQTIANIVLATIERKMSHDDLYRVVIMNRGFFDMSPFTNANFLFGRLDVRKLASAKLNIQSGINFLNEYHNAVMLLLTTRDESLRRNRESGDLNFGRAMNPKFLPVLYEQYLRFHQGMVDTGRVEMIDQQIPYVAVDMSGEDIESAISNYTVALISILRYFLDF